MSCWALETCLTYVPRQRRRCSREKVDHHQPARFLVGACRRRPPGDPSHSSARPRFEKRFSQRPRAWPAPGLYVARSERTEPPPPSDGSARDLRQNVEFSQIWVHVILRHVRTGQRHVLCPRQRRTRYRPRDDPQPTTTPVGRFHPREDRLRPVCACKSFLSYIQ